MWKTCSSHGYGNGREINFLFIGLARAAGFEAAEVLVAPRNINFFYPQLQEVSELGADVVWVRAGSQEYYLDPASCYFPFSLLPWSETNTEGFRLSKKPNDYVTIPLPTSADSTVVRDADLTIDEDGLATGKLTVDFTGQKAALWRGEFICRTIPAAKNLSKTKSRRGSRLARTSKSPN